MKQNYERRYRLTKPPQSVRQARLDNLAIVPASMLPFTKALADAINKLPPGGVFLCHAEANNRQETVLKRVGEHFMQHGHAVTATSTGQVQ